MFDGFGVSRDLGRSVHTPWASAREFGHRTLCRTKQDPDHGPWRLPWALACSIARSSTKAPNANREASQAEAASQSLTPYDPS